MSRDARFGIGLCAAVLVIGACCGLAAAGAGGLWFVTAARAVENAPTPVSVARPSPTLTLRPATPTRAISPLPVTPAPSPTAIAGPGRDTLSALQAAVLPVRDLRELTQRFKGLAAIPRTVSDLPADHAIGTVLAFNVHNSDTGGSSSIQARLIDKTDNAYFFAEQGLSVDEAAVHQLLGRFQNDIYPTDRAFFGSEWTPGVDGDPRLYILYARGLGFGLLGYYYPVDEYSRLAYPASNEKEIFFVNADATGPSDPSLLYTLAHEFQHMIGWNLDLNEDTWMNEGMAMLAELLNGYQPRGYILRFAQDPDVQLNAWTDGDTIPHYGAALMYLAYLLDRFGDDTLRAVVADPANGLTAVDDVLAARSLTDPADGHPLTADDLLADWAITNYLDDAAAQDGRYAYHRLESPPQAAAADTLDRCPLPEHSETVHQYGTDYYVIRCVGTYTLSFTGAAQVPVAPAPPDDGRIAAWSNRGDESATSLTRAFDLSGLSTATLTYKAWWETEENYDYVYVEASTDDGATWTILRAPSSTDANPVGASFGWGYTGRSNGWVDESVDLSPYAGRPILVRFEQITDTALNLPGFLVDDIRVPELNYAADFEHDDGGWEMRGFVRMDNVLPQRFIVQVIVKKSGTASVERMALDGDNHGQLMLALDGGDTAILVVSGATRFTTEPASYQFSIQ